MNTPQAVIFDLGKVLLEFDYSIGTRNLAARAKVDAAEMHKIVCHTPHLFQYETGLMTTADFFELMRKETGFHGTIEEFADLFGNIFAPMEPMIALHAELKKRRVPTFIFSNTNEFAIQHIRAKYPFFGGFDGYVLSYEHGAMKPDTKLYEVVERMTGRKREQLLYIDDRPENIATGVERGWQVILQEHPDKTIAAVKKAGLL